MSGGGLFGAVEAGGTKIVCALARTDGTVIDRARIATANPQTTLAELRAFFAAAATRHGGAYAGFGVGSFGPLDLDPASPGCGTITTTPKPGWSGVSWPAALGLFGAPVIVATDVEAAALGEWSRGAGQGCRTLAYTTVGTGIGSAVLDGGESRRGLSHLECGHIPTPHDRAVDPFPGLCPFHGDCLEGLASGPAIAARWGGELPSRGSEGIALIAGYLAHLAATLILSHCPERLIFGGGVMETPGLLEALRERTGALLGGYLAAPAFSGDLAGTVVRPKLGGDAGIVGALVLARRAAYQKKSWMTSSTSPL